MTKVSAGPVLKTHHFFHACKHILGESSVLKIFNISRKQYHRWAADPAFASDKQKNPLDHLKKAIEKLYELGELPIAMGAVNILARVINCRLTYNGDFQDCGVFDKDNLAEECLDDLPAVAAYHEALMTSNDPDAVRHLLDEAIRELEQNFQLFSIKQMEKITKHWKSSKGQVTNGARKR